MLGDADDPLRLSARVDDDDRSRRRVSRPARRRRPPRSRAARRARPCVRRSPQSRARTRASARSSATVTRVTLSAATPSIADRRTVELLRGRRATSHSGITRRRPRSPARRSTPHSIPPTAPAVGRAVELVDATSAYDATVVSAVPAPDLPGHLAIVVSPGPSAPLHAATAALLGNVVKGSQGETVTDELLGSGDASAAVPALQARRSRRSRACRTPGAPHGGASTLVVRVDGVQWQRACSTSTATARTTACSSSSSTTTGSTYVRFGDGVIGSRLPTGAQVTADYRTGLGTAGNVAVGDAHLAADASEGAAERDQSARRGRRRRSRDDRRGARRTRPTTVRTFERIVSLRDARTRRARTRWSARRTACMRSAPSRRTVTVAGAGGAQLGATSSGDLQADLDARRDPNRALVVRGYRPAGAVDRGEADRDRRPIAIRRTSGRSRGCAACALRVRRSASSASRCGSARCSSRPSWSPACVGVDVDLLTLADRRRTRGALPQRGREQERIDLQPDELATLDASNLTVTVAT